MSCVVFDGYLAPHSCFSLPPQAQLPFIAPPTMYASCTLFAPCSPEPPSPHLSSSSQGHTLVVKILLSAGATVDIQARDGETPLMHAANNGHLSCIELLLAAGAKVNHQSKQAGNTALLVASTRLHRQCVLRLLSAGTRRLHGWQCNSLLYMS